MDKEKEIEEMAHILSKMPQCKSGCKGCGGLYEYGCTARDDAITLIDAGYGNVEQAVKEFAEWVIDLLYANSVANESEQHTHIASTPEELQDEINAKLKELYGK